VLRGWHERILSDKNKLMREVIPMMFASTPEPADMQWMFDEMTRAPEVIAAAIMFDQSTRDYQDQLAAYPIPTLVCGGGRSAQPRAGLELITELVPNSRLLIFEENGHCLFLENAARFNLEIERFAASV
jgi:pimeloyl-ACP methyl ester carboxylesterase